MLGDTHDVVSKTIRNSLPRFADRLHCLSEADVGLVAWSQSAFFAWMVDFGSNVLRLFHQFVHEIVDP